MRRSATALGLAGLAALAAVPVAAGVFVARRAAALWGTPTVTAGPGLVEVSTAGLPGWVARAGDGRRWALFLPGLGSHPLRHADLASSFAEHGWTSLFGAHSARRPAPRHRFGVVERHEALQWLRFAADQGAEEVVLLGWSFGASLWLHAVSRTDLPVRVRVVVLTGPLVDWSDAVAHAVGGGVVGRLVAGSARLVLALPGLCRLAGQPARTPLVPASPPAAPVPALAVLHGDADRTVPVHASRRLVDGWPGPASLTIVPGAAHGSERDSDPAGWLDVVARSVYCL